MSLNSSTSPGTAPLRCYGGDQVVPLNAVPKPRVANLLLERTMRMNVPREVRARAHKIGTVQRVMLDKISGKVAYAVISFGGFLGMGEDYFPMPWASLKYDTALGGYRVGITEDQLNNAPRFNRSTDWDWSDRARDRSVYDYYKTPLWY